MRSSVAVGKVSTNQTWFLIGLMLSTAVLDPLWMTLTLTRSLRYREPATMQGYWAFHVVVANVQEAYLLLPVADNGLSFGLNQNFYSWWCSLGSDISGSFYKIDFRMSPTWILKSSSRTVTKAIAQALKVGISRYLQLITADIRSAMCLDHGKKWLDYRKYIITTVATAGQMWNRH